MKCRHCGQALKHPFLDLGSAPPSNAYLRADELEAPETHFPLKTLVCTGCWLVQTADYARSDALFSADYAYFSSYSSSWLRHAEIFVEQMVARFALGAGSQVVEVAANDGYLLQYVKARGIPCLGIEPTRSTAKAARARGIKTLGRFFGLALGQALAGSGSAADLAIANNVLAHVPDINDFVAGFAALLKEQGVATFEFPHLMRMVEFKQFDTTYHEHYSYLSLGAVSRIFAANGLSIFDVEELPTHGGSLRVFAQRRDSGRHASTSAEARILAEEERRGMTALPFYADFQRCAETMRDDFTAFLVAAKRAGKRLGGYGAAAKGNTLLNFAGTRPDLLPYVVDRNPNKVGRFLPGSRIPIVEEAHLKDDRPDYLVILPWNLRREVIDQLAYIRAWGGKFVFAVPQMEVL